MRSAQRLTRLTESFIDEMMVLAMKHDAVNLSQGFPNFDPPPQVLDAVSEALQNGYNQYALPWGSPRLRAAIADKYARCYDMPVDPNSDVTVTCGVTEAIITALLCVVDPGDRVIIIEPAHEGYAPQTLFAGGEPVWICLSPPDFELTETQLRAAFARRPRAIILNTPHNPTGRVLSRETLTLIAELCVEHDTVAICDEIYEHILYDGCEHIPLATLPGMAERTITISGLGKTYAATGWRIGWMLTPPALSSAARTVHTFLTVCAPAPLQEAAVAALALPDDFYTDLARDYAARREVMMSTLEESGFRFVRPQGAYYVMADFSDILPDPDDMAFARWLVSEKQVAVVPGRCFYHDPALGQRMVRFAFAKRMETLEEARRRLAGAGGRNSKL